MSEVPLSSSWMKLQGKLKTDSKISKELKKKPRSQDAHQHTGKEIIKSLLVKKSNAALQQAKYEKVTPVMSVTELALWNRENHISASDLLLPTSLAPPDTSLSSRKRQPGKFLAIDCEFVGVGPEGVESALARVSIVNFYGYVILDKYVKPREKVTDWRTWVSGILPKHMKDAITFKELQQLCSDLFKDRVLVGHAIHHDLDSLLLSHPASQIRDTSLHLPFRKISNGKTPGLKKLTKEFLKMDIQSGEHSSVEDARATMLLYRMHKQEFEVAHRLKYANGRKPFSDGQKSNKKFGKK